MAELYGKNVFSFVRNHETLNIPTSTEGEFLLLHILISIWGYAYDFGFSSIIIHLNFKFL